VLNGYYCSHSAQTTSWLAGQFSYGVRCGHRGLLTGLVEAAQAGCLLPGLGKGPADHERSTGLTTTGGGLDPPRGSVCPPGQTHCNATPIFAVMAQCASARHRPTWANYPSSPATYFIFGTQVKTLSDINVVTRRATADHHSTRCAVLEIGWRENDNKTSLAPLTVQSPPPFRFK